MQPEELTPQERASLIEDGIVPTTPTQPSAWDATASGPQLDGILHKGLTDIWRDFAMRWSEVLTVRLKTDVVVELTEVQASSYGDMVFAADRPTCFHVVRAPQIPGPLVIELTPRLALPLVDCMLGETSFADPVAARSLTTIEAQLIERLTERMLDQVCDAWLPIVSLSPTIERTESNPRVVRAAHPGEPFVVAQLTVSLGAATGRLRVGLPLAFVEAHREALAQSHVQTAGGQSPSVDGCQRLRVVLAEVMVPHEELMSLRVGDILTTDQAAEEPAKVLINDRPVYWAQPGAHQGQKAVRLASRF